QVVLFACAKGKEIASLDEPCCHLMGAALADLHGASGDFADAPVRYDLENLLTRPLRALEPFLVERPGDRDFLRGLAGRLRHGIKGRPPGRLAGGYSPGVSAAANFRLDEATGELTLFVFEWGGMGSRAYDPPHPRPFLPPRARELLGGAPPRE